MLVIPIILLAAAVVLAGMCVENGCAAIAKAILKASGK